MRKVRRILSVICMLSLVLGAVPVFGAQKEPVAVIYYTNDIHGVYENMAKIKALAEKEDAILVDAGDAIQGSIATTLTKGQAMVDVMDAVDYDVQIPGNHEFDFGMDRFMEIDRLRDYVCVNLKTLDDGKLVMEPYKIIDADGDPSTEDDQIAFVGAVTPLTIGSTTPAFFQDENGDWAYTFLSDGTGEELYNAAQEAIDAAKNEGADYVICVGHLGEELGTNPYMSSDLIRNTVGFDALIDAHAHDIVEEKWVKDKNGEDVLMTQTGTKLAYVGRMEIASDGTISARLIDVATLTETDPEVQAVVDQIAEQINEVSLAVIADSEVALQFNDPVTGKRLIRHAETNLGDFITDAYRGVLGTEIGMANGGGIRANVEIGDVTNGDLIAVHPFGNTMCIAEVTGQQILDALEMGVMFYPGESGSFLQVSGLTYELHSYIPSGVKLSAEGDFLGVDGEYRVKNVMVGGEPMDVNKIYTLGSHNYLLQSGAYTMFNDAKILRDEIMPDNEALITYIKDNLGGVLKADGYENPYGAGRITVVDEAPVDVSAKVTRGLAVKMLYELEMEESAATADAVRWAKENGIAAGYTDGTFGENDLVTRQQMATFLHKYAMYKGIDVSVGEDTNILSYDDFMEISDYAFPALQWACGSGVMKGRTDGTLDPRGTIIYSEAQWMIRNYEGM